MLTPQISGMMSSRVRSFTKGCLVSGFPFPFLPPTVAIVLKPAALLQELSKDPRINPFPGSFRWCTTSPRKVVRLWRSYSTALPTFFLSARRASHQKLTKIGAIERRYRLASYAFPPYGRVGVSYLSEKTKERFHMIGKRSNRALPVASGIGMRQVRAR